jgi:cytochrome P450
VSTITDARFAGARFDDAMFYLDDPHATYRALREDDPLHWYDSGGFWVATKYDDIRFISSRPDLFSSEQVGILSDLRAIRAGRGEIEAGTRGMMFLDPPKHAQQRKIVSHRFTPGAIAALEVGVREVVVEVVEGLPAGEFDWIEHVAEPIPVFAFSRVLGVPRQDWHQIVEWSTVIAAAGGGEVSDDDIARITNEVGPYLWELLCTRRAEPTDDLLSLLATAEVDGQPLDDGMAITHALTLLAAGSETTQSLIAGMAWCLSEFRDQAGSVFDDPRLVSGAVEETLRWWTPVMSMARQAVTDVELRDKTIRAGEGVLLLYSAANRDADQWGEDAERFDVLRPEASRHLGFGFGEHFCLGAHLARQEARVLLEELTSRAIGIEVVGEPVLRRSPLIHTFDRLPVQLSWR